MRILVIDDDKNIRDSLSWLLEKEGHAVTLCSSGEEALEIGATESFDLGFCDVMMPGIGGLKALEKLLALQPDLQMIMISGQADIPTAVNATKIGAYDFMEKPLNPEKVLLEVKKLEKQRSVQMEAEKLKHWVDMDYRMIGNSPKMQELLQVIKKVAPTDGRVLIFGENGTGKELVAREIHKQSGRQGHFVQLNCAALPKELIESELFGYEKGAFTGAQKRKIGLIEEAQGGTLLLDEIGDMAAETQAKLLRVLQENEFTRVGSTKPQKFDVRIIAATNKNLQTAINKGEFRQDLYFRLNVIPIVIPPLRDRVNDVPDLVQHFLQLYAVKNGKKPKTVTFEAMQKLKSYVWPGNIRELRNIIERLSIMIRGDEIDEEDVDNVLGLTHLPKTSPAPSQQTVELPLKEQLYEFERQILQKAFKSYDGNVSHMASALQTDRANLHKKLKKYGIK